MFLGRSYNGPHANKSEQNRTAVQQWSVLNTKLTIARVRNGEFITYCFSNELSSYSLYSVTKLLERTLPVLNLARFAFSIKI